MDHSHTRTPSLTLSLEQSRQERTERFTSKFRNRGGIFVPTPQRNDLFQCLIGKKAISPVRAFRSPSPSPSIRRISAKAQPTSSTTTSEPKGIPKGTRVAHKSKPAIQSIMASTSTRKVNEVRKNPSRKARIPNDLPPDADVRVSVDKKEVKEVERTKAPAKRKGRSNVVETTQEDIPDAIPLPKAKKVRASRSKKVSKAVEDTTQEPKSRPRTLPPGRKTESKKTSRKSGNRAPKGAVNAPTSEDTLSTPTTLKIRPKGPTVTFVTNPTPDEGEEPLRPPKRRRNQQQTPVCESPTQETQDPEQGYTEQRHSKKLRLEHRMPSSLPHTPPRRKTSRIPNTVLRKMSKAAEHNVVLDDDPDEIDFLS